MTGGVNDDTSDLLAGLRAARDALMANNRPWTGPVLTRPFVFGPRHDVREKLDQCRVRVYTRDTAAVGYRLKTWACRCAGCGAEAVWAGSRDGWQLAVAWADWHARGQRGPGPFLRWFQAHSREGGQDG